MKDHIVRAIDARQTQQWAHYMESIGWRTKIIGKTHLFIKKLPFFDASFMKIQHPQGPFPFERIDEVARKNKTIWTILEPHVVGYEESEFGKHGYMKSRMLQVHTATIKIDLNQNEKDLFKSFSENARRNIKKANHLVALSTRTRTLQTFAILGAGGWANARSGAGVRVIAADTAAMANFFQ